MHYAGDVTYNVNGFLEKNNDLLFRDLREVMTKSTNPIISSCFSAVEWESKKRPDTAVTQFKNSLNDLVKILMGKEPSYIRCIKPNELQASGRIYVVNFLSIVFGCIRCHLAVVIRNWGMF